MGDVRRQSTSNSGRETIKLQREINSSILTSQTLPYLDLIESEVVFLSELVYLLAFAPFPVNTVSELFQCQSGGWAERGSLSSERSVVKDNLKNIL